MDQEIRRYIVQFGKQAYVAAFAADQSYRRDDEVVIRTVRGEEIGTIRCAAGPTANSIGEIRREATSTDRERHSFAEAKAREVLDATSEAVDQPIHFVDAEATLDDLVLLHVLPTDACDLSHRLKEWSDRFRVRVSLVDLTIRQTLPDAPDAQDGNCGKPNCGEGNCSSSGGCSTGNCSRGAVKSADELTEYFKSLRRQMEADTIGRLPLH